MSRVLEVQEGDILVLFDISASANVGLYEELKKYLLFDFLLVTNDCPGQPFIIRRAEK